MFDPNAHIKGPVDPEAFLKIYKHESKYEDPRYLTSAVSYLKLERISFI
jgi:hypothetical protein